MALPKISISYLNGQLGTVPTSQDGLMALVCGAAAESSFELQTAYKIYRLEGLAELGITAETEDNQRLYAVVKDFYSVAPDGTPVIIYGVDKSKKMTELCDKDSGPLKQLLQSQRGDIRGIIIARAPESPEEVTSTEGLDPDVFTAIPKAQALTEYAATSLYAPIFVALEGRSYKDASSLKDLSEGNDNTVCVVIGDTENTGVNAAMGLFAAKVAISPVQRNIGRVRDSNLPPTKMYLGTKLIEDSMDDVATIYDKGYITPRTYVGRAGYYYTDDRMACDPTDDYAHLTARRTVDKAYRIAYDTLLDYLIDEIYVNTDGTMQDAVLKNWQASVEDAINGSMTANGELSADTAAGESGCQCLIDPTQNILSTSKVNVVLKVRPFGYARDIVVQLGFQVEKS